MCFFGVAVQVKIWFQNRRSKVKKQTKHGGGSVAHSTITDADCSVSGTDEVGSSDDNDDEERDAEDHHRQPETRDSNVAAATPPAADHCIGPPTAQHRYPPPNIPPSQIAPPPPSSSSPYFQPAVVRDWTDLPPPPLPPVGVIPPAYPDYFYPSNAAVAMAGYHTSSAAGAVGLPSCPLPSGPYYHWQSPTPSQHSLLA